MLQLIDPCWYSWLQRTWERAKMATTLDHVGIAPAHLAMSLCTYIWFWFFGFWYDFGTSAVVATDDYKIAECCKRFWCWCCNDITILSKWYEPFDLCDLDSTRIRRQLFICGAISLGINIGTERCNEALQMLGRKYDVVVNIQDDEPLREPEIIDGIVKVLQVMCCWVSFPLLFIVLFDINRILRNWTNLACYK